MVRLSNTASPPRAPGPFGLVLALAGLALGVWLALRNGADLPSLLVTGMLGIGVGAVVGVLHGTRFIVAFFVAFLGGLLVHITYAGSVAPLWPFALFVGMTVAGQVVARRTSSKS